ncbi:MAG TPA: hypothetical protein VGQ14_00530 [Candidatus Eisenbacteria bacterium]|jgi:hypothetical protein|nr:hypothetical protein [Candidatus Eisenbacteria bacterium]
MKPLSAALRLFVGGALAMVFMTAGAAGQSGTGKVEPPSTTMLAQADTSGVPVFEGDDEGDEGDEEEVPIPPNLQDKETLPDTGAVAPDTLRHALPVSPGLPDTLHMPGSQPPGNPGGRAAGSTLPTTPAKSKGSLFGLAPVFVIGAIVVVNVLIIKAVGGD